MGTQSFFITADTLSASTPEVALERLRNRQIVDRFNGESINSFDSASGVFRASFGDTAYLLGSYSGIDGSTFNRVRSGSQNWYYSTLDVLQHSRTFPVLLASGTHINAFNCSFDFNKGISTNAAPVIGFASSGSTGIENGIAISNAPSGRVSEGAASTRSINMFGCTSVVRPIRPQSGQEYIIPVYDCIYSLIHFIQPGSATAEGRAVAAGQQDTTTKPADGPLTGTDFPVVAVLPGARVIGSSFIGNLGTSNHEVRFYSVPEVFESNEINRMRIVGMPNARGHSLTNGTRWLDIEDFTRFEWRRTTTNNVNGYRPQDACFFNIAPHMPRDNVLSNAVGIVGNPYYFGDNLSGGLINYYSWDLTFQEDTSAGSAIPGVRVRTTSNVPIRTTSVRTAIDNFAEVINQSASSIIDRTGLPDTVINEYVSNSAGKVALDRNSRYSSDGGTTFFNNSHYDWLQYNVVDTSTVRDTLAVTLSGQDAPDNVVVLPIQDIRRGVYNQYAATIRARSYSHTVEFPDRRETGVIGTAAGQQPANTKVPIEQITALGFNEILSTENPTGTIVAATETAAINAVDTSGLSTIREPQQYSDYLRARWSRFDIDDLRGVAGSNLEWTAGDITFSTNTGNTIFSNSNADITFQSITDLNNSPLGSPITGITVNNGNSLILGAADSISTYVNTNGVDLTADDLVINGNTGNAIYTRNNTSPLQLAPGTTHTRSNFIGDVQTSASVTLTDCSISGNLTIVNIPTLNGLQIIGNITSAGSTDLVFNGGSINGNFITYGGNRLTFTDGTIINDSVQLPSGTGKTLVLGAGVGSQTFRDHATAQGWTLSTAAANYVFSFGPRAGRIALRNITTGQDLIAPTDIFTQQNQTIAVDDSRVSNGNLVRAYYKPENEYAAGFEQWYETTILSFVWDSTTASTYSLIPRLIPSTVRSDEIYEGAATAPAYSSLPSPSLIIPITGADNVGSDLTSGICKNLLSRVTTTDAYFQAMVLSGQTSDMIQPGVNSTALASNIRVSSNEANIQQFMQGLVNRDNTAFGIENFASAPIPTVLNLASEFGITRSDVTAGVDNTNIANGVGYMIGTEDDSSLIGVRPKDEDYDRDTNYRGNL